MALSEQAFKPIRADLSRLVSRPAVEALKKGLDTGAGAATDLTALTARVVILEADVATLQTQMITALADIATLESEVAALQTLSTVSLTASEGLAAGSIVNIWDDSGTAKARLAAVSDDTKEANGFVLAAVLSGATASVYLPGGRLTGLVGLTPGVLCFLAAGGTVTQSVPASGWLQIVGRAVSATAIAFQPQSGTLL